MFVGFMRTLCDSVPDWVWPHLSGEEDDCPTDKERFNTKHSGSLNDMSSFLPSRLAQMDERLKAVESKLLAMLTLTSVLSAALAASLAAATTLGSVNENTKALALGAALLVFYVSIQVLRSLWATVSGLMRKSYKQLSLCDLIPKDGEIGDSYKIRLLNLQANHLSWNEWVVDKKVGHMTVAHTALRNALTAVFVLVVLILGIAVFHLLFR